MFRAQYGVIMSRLKQDVTLTLIIKFCLLFLLWFCCIKGKKADINMQTWLFTKNSSYNSHSSVANLKKNY